MKSIIRYLSSASLALSVFILSLLIFKLVNTLSSIVLLNVVLILAVGFAQHFYLAKSMNAKWTEYISTQVIMIIDWSLTFFFVGLATLTYTLMVRNGTYSSTQVMQGFMPFTIAALYCMMAGAGIYVGEKRKSV